MAIPVHPGPSRPIPAHPGPSHRGGWALQELRQKTGDNVKRLVALESKTNEIDSHLLHIRDTVSFSFQEYSSGQETKLRQLETRLDGFCTSIDEQLVVGSRKVDADHLVITERVNSAEPWSVCPAAVVLASCYFELR